MNKKSNTSERVKTGIKKLDKILGGGFPKNSIVVLSGGVGAGKTTFGLQFVHENLTAGNPALIISTKDRPEDLIMHSAGFSWNLEKWQREEMLKIVFYSPNELRTIIGGGAGSLLDLIDDISASIVFIDSLGFISSSFDKLSDLISFSFTFMNTFKKMEITTLATVEHAHKMEKMELWEHLADGAINLYNYTEKAKRYRYMELLKMRNTQINKDFLPYKVNSKGIELVEK